jgi:hypothetical protein
VCLYRQIRGRRDPRGRAIWDISNLIGAVSRLYRGSKSRAEASWGLNSRHVPNVRLAPFLAGTVPSRRRCRWSRSPVQPDQLRACLLEAALGELVDECPSFYPPDVIARPAEAHDALVGFSRRHLRPRPPQDLPMAPCRQYASLSPRPLRGSCR